MDYIRLGDLCIINSGGTPKRNNESYWKNGDIPWVKISDLKNGVVESTEEFITVDGLKNSSAKIFPQGALLYTIFATIGEVAILNIDAATNQAVVGLQLKENQKVYLKYIYYYLKSQTNNIKQLGRGVAQNNINLSVVKNMIIPIVSLEKQSNIIATLSKIEKIKENRIILSNYLDDLIKSRFDELIMGDKCDRLMFNDLFFCTTGKLDSNAAVKGGRYPFFTCAKEIFYINDYAFDQEALLLAGNNAAGKYDIKYYNGKFNAYQRTYVLSLRKKGIYSIFKKQLEDKLEYLQSQSKGSTTRYLTMGILKNLTFCVPDMEIQLKLDKEIRQINKLKSDVQKSIDETQLLMDSLMQEYFG